MQAMGQTRPLQMPLGKFLLPEVVAKCLLGSEATSAGAGKGPGKTSPNAVREISFQCKKGLMILNVLRPLTLAIVTSERKLLTI
jgi:hypothetical protein